MSQGWTGIDGKARKIKNIYIGVNNKAHKCVLGYVGVDGIARKIYPIINVPSVIKQYYYTGENQILELYDYDPDEISLSCEDAEASGNTFVAKDVHTYVITCSLKDNNAYWEDGTTGDKTITWSIQSAIIAPPVPDPSQPIYWNASFSDYKCYNRLIWDDSVSNIDSTYEFVGNKQNSIPAGNHQIRVTLSKNDFQEYNVLFTGSTPTAVIDYTVLKTHLSLVWHGMGVPDNYPISITSGDEWSESLFTKNEEGEELWYGLPMTVASTYGPIIVVSLESHNTGNTLKCRGGDVPGDYTSRSANVGISIAETSDYYRVSGNVYYNVYGRT